MGTYTLILEVVVGLGLVLKPAPDARVLEVLHYAGILARDWTT